jgi:hypothetical protein
MIKLARRAKCPVGMFAAGAGACEIAFALVERPVRNHHVVQMQKPE